MNRVSNAPNVGVSFQKLVIQERGKLSREAKVTHLQCVTLTLECNFSV